MVYGIARGYEAQGRQAGFSTHPNYFAQAGMLSLALLIYLAYRHRGRLMLLIIPATIACGASVILSGSRAATVVVAVLVVMIPIVERSAVTGFLLAVLAALAFLLLPIVAGFTGPGSSIARLAEGNTSAQFSNTERSLGIGEGVDRFFTHPFTGTGLTELYEIHNNFLEVAVAIGIFGLAGYLIVLYTFARPLFSTGEYRRLAYGVWGYIGFGATVPSLYDRSIWAVVALSVVAMIEHERRRLAPASAGPGLGVRRPSPVPPDKLVPTVQ
jgi:O-antigen ligase